MHVCVCVCVHVCVHVHVWCVCVCGSHYLCTRGHNKNMSIAPPSLLGFVGLLSSLSQRKSSGDSRIPSPDSCTPPSTVTQRDDNSVRKGLLILYSC